MNKLKHLLMVAVVVAVGMVSCDKDEDLSNLSGQTHNNEYYLCNGLFSVSEGRQVRFALGNLDYDGDYFFAPHQYDYGGLFGWGTGDNPTCTSTNHQDYTVFNDWGAYIAPGWRTLTNDEWKYVVWYRPNADQKRGSATVCNVHGMVLLPDNYDGGNFTSGFNGWGTNVYDAATWSAMEADGVVFLPAAGYRYRTQEDKVGGNGFYWSATPNVGNCAYFIVFGDGDVNDDDSYRIFGRSVRLVHDYNN